MSEKDQSIETQETNTGTKFVLYEGESRQIAKSKDTLDFANPYIQINEVKPASALAGPMRINISWGLGEKDLDGTFKPVDLSGRFETKDDMKEFSYLHDFYKDTFHPSAVMHEGVNKVDPIFWFQLLKCMEALQTGSFRSGSSLFDHFNKAPEVIQSVNELNKTDPHDRAYSDAGGGNLDFLGHFMAFGDRDPNKGLDLIRKSCPPNLVPLIHELQKRGIPIETSGIQRVVKQGLLEPSPEIKRLLPPSRAQVALDKIKKLWKDQGIVMDRSNPGKGLTRGGQNSFPESRGSN